MCLDMYIMLKNLMFDFFFFCTFLSSLGFILIMKYHRMVTTKRPKLLIPIYPIKMIFNQLPMIVSEI